MNKRIFQSLTIFTIGLLLTGCAGKKLKPFKQPPPEARQRYLANVDVDDEDIRKAIKKGTVIVGMTMDQVVASWGEPHLMFVNQWEYRAWRNIILKFNQGRVSEIKHYTNF